MKQYFYTLSIALLYISNTIAMYTLKDNPCVNIKRTELGSKQMGNKYTRYDYVNLNKVVFITAKKNKSTNEITCQQYVNGKLEMDIKNNNIATNFYKALASTYKRRYYS